MYNRGRDMASPRRASRRLSSPHGTEVESPLAPHLQHASSGEKWGSNHRTSAGRSVVHLIQETAKIFGAARRSNSFTQTVVNERLSTSLHPTSLVRRIMSACRRLGDPAAADVVPASPSWAMPPLSFASRVHDSLRSVDSLTGASREDQESTTERHQESAAVRLQEAWRGHSGMIAATVVKVQKAWRGHAVRVLFASPKFDFFEGD